MNIIDQNNDLIRALCLKFKVKSLYAFGSVLTDEFKKSSDIDLIVDFMDVNLNDYADNYFELKSSLEKLFKREVDLLENKAITNPFLRKSIENSKQLIFG
jgi:uncharacterized protein